MAAHYEPLKEEIGELRATTVTKAEFEAITEPMDDKLASLYLRVAELEKKRDAPKEDIAHYRLSFKGFSKESHDVRVETLKSFMETNFPNEQYACVDHKTKGPQKKEMSDISFVQFHTRGARDRVLKQIQSKNLKKHASDSGSSLDIDRMRTQRQSQRNWAMRKAEEEINKKLKANGANVKAEYVAEKEKPWTRKIIVNGKDAFVQLSGDERGAFVGDFQDISLPQ